MIREQINLPETHRSIGILFQIQASLESLFFAY